MRLTWIDHHLRIHLDRHEGPNRSHDRCLGPGHPWEEGNPWNPLWGHRSDLGWAHGRHGRVQSRCNHREERLLRGT